MSNPGNIEEIVGEITLANSEIALKAIESSNEAFTKWASEAMEKRVQVVSEALDQLENKRNEFAHCITVENGKPLAEAYGEIDAALSDGRFQLAQAKDKPSQSGQIQISEKITGEIWHVPVGVFLLITPWNFPLATVLRKLVPAIVWGNTAIVKPAQQTPFSAGLIFDCLELAGLPKNVANLIIGKGSDIGETLVGHHKVKGISFTGSTEVGTGICRQVAGRNVRLQMEMGGKNALVILNDADLNAAVQAAVTAAFTCSGQWCTATSRIIVEDGIYDSFCKQLVKAVSRLRMGNGLDPDVTFGPVASKKQKETAIQSIQQAKQEEAKLLCGGRAHDVVNGKQGYYVEPTVFSDVTESMQLFREEIFGPVLAVTRAKNVEDALRLVNMSPYGLSFSVYTAEHEKAFQFLEGADCGMVHHNLHTAYRHPALPITGWKESGRGIPECGQYARDFYTQIKTVYQYI